MTDEPRQTEPVEGETPSQAPAEDAEPQALSPEDEELERRLSEPVLQGQVGIETAQVVISAFLIIIVGLITFSSAMTAPLHAEDQALIRDTRGLQHFATFGDALKERPAQPVFLAALAKQMWFGLDSPSSFHAINVILHLLNGVLVFLLVRQLSRRELPEPVAMVAGLLFVLHPLVTESVVYVVGRAELLATCFALISTLTFVAALKATQGKSYLFFAGSLVSLMLAWGSKPDIVALPVLVLAADRLAVVSAQGLRRSVAYGAYWGLLASLILFHVVAFEGSTSGSVHTGTLAARLAALGSHIQWVWSPVLSIYYPGPIESGVTGLAGAALLALLAVAGLALTILRRLGGFGLLWYAGFLLSAVWLVPFDHVMAERNDYLALAGLVMLVPWGFSLVPRQPGWLRTAAGVVVAVLILVSAAASFMRTQVWQTEEALWTDAAAKYPDSAMPQRQLGRIHVETGLESYQMAMAAQQNQPGQVEPLRGAAMDSFRAAEEALQRAIDIEPTDAEAWYYLGQAREYAGNFDAAATAYKEALRREPGRVQALLHLAMTTEALAHASGERQRLSEAVQYYGRAEELGILPNELKLRYADTLVALGEFATAQALLAGLGSDGANAPAKALLDRLQPTLQGLNGLQQQLNAAMQVDPNSADALRLRGQLLALTGKNVQAGYLLESALAKNPQDASAWITLGVARAAANSSESFIQEWGSAAPRTPDGTSPWIQLARGVAANGQWEAATAYLEAGKVHGDQAVAKPLLVLAEVAVAINQPGRAAQYLQAAADADPLDPEPWLRLTDLALEAKDLASARIAFQKAQQRNASPEALESRRPKLGEFTPQTETGTTILR